MRDYRHALLVPVLSALAILASCGGEDGPTIPAPDPPRAAAISISPESVTLTMIGETATFTASITDQNGASFSGNVTWTSDALQVFTVDGTGTVTAVGNGAGRLTAAHAGLSATASVTVDAPENLPPRSKGTLPDYHVAVGGGTLPFLPQAYFEDPDDDILELTFTVAVANSSIGSAEVVVDEAGHVAILLTGLAPGETTLTVTATDPGGLSGEDSHKLTVDDSGFTPYPDLRVGNGTIDFAGITIPTCTPPIVNAPNVEGFFITVNRTWWQTRSDSAAAWTNIDGTEASTGQLCPYASQTPGEYRLVFNLTVVIDEHHEPLTGGFRSENTFVVTDDSTGGNQAPTIVPTAPREVALSVGGGAYFLTPEQLFTDPNGDELAFSAAVSDAAVLSVEVSVDIAGHTLVIARGTGAGSGTLTITATDPGDLTAELAIEVSVDDTGYTPYYTLSVSNGALHALGRAFAVCLPPVINLRGPDGYVYTVHSSKWQRRSDASAAWTDIEDTERTDGTVCPYLTQEVGDYRLVYESTVVVDPHVPGFRGKYASANFFTVAAN